MNIKLNELADYLAKSVSKDAPHYRQEYDKLIAERDTSDVWRQFAIWLLVPDDGVIRFTKPNSKQHAVIKNVAYLYLTHCQDRKIWKAAVKDADADADAASWAAASAAYYAARAAWSAAFDAHAHAAAAAAYYAAAAAVKAAAQVDAADAAYAAAGATAAAYKHMADKLLELLQSAPPKKEII